MGCKCRSLTLVQLYLKLAFFSTKCETLHYKLENSVVSSKYSRFLITERDNSVQLSMYEASLSMWTG